ncbi:MAG: ABC transporter ATP-binding protein [Candidatus Eremiobacteraeota bacterium]|nr:ABC transporter ATP-binding protein [Candidatus Eremiobacteraeota bacterium]
MCALQAHALTKSFGPHRAVDNVTLRINRAERLVVLGPSAAGKTTLLRLLAGLETADSGSVTLGGTDVTQARAARRNIGLVFQNGALFTHLNVFENLAFALRLQRKSASIIRTRVGEVAALFEISDLLKCPATILSGGERQRVAIARALLAGPRALLLDEPLAHLDPAARTAVRDALLTAARSAGAGIAVVTHDHEEALTLADRLAVLIGGRIVQCDAPERVYDWPASTAVARFLGPRPMNLFDDMQHQFAPGALTIGIRPHDIRFGSAGEGFEGVVTAREFYGPAWIARVQTAFGALDVADPTAKPAVGERVRLHFPAGKIRRFDRSSGEAIP